MALQGCSLPSPSFKIPLDFWTFSSWPVDKAEYNFRIVFFTFVEFDFTSITTSHLTNLKFPILRKLLPHQNGNSRSRW